MHKGVSASGKLCAGKRLIRARLRARQARRGALSTCGQFWITHRATLPLKADRPRTHAF